MSPTLSRGRRMAATAATLTVLTGVAALPAWAGEPAFTLHNGKIGDISGLVRDTHDQRYWVASGARGGQLMAYAVDVHGKVIGPVRSTDRMLNVTALAWRDRRLYLGDIGGARRQVTIWGMLGPVPNTLINRAERMTVSYPDGSHTAEAMFVDEKGRIYVVTNGKTEGAIYAAPAEAHFGADESYTFERVGSAPAGVTDAAILDDGRVVVRTITEAVTLDATTWHVLATEPIADQPRGGSLAVEVGGQALLASGVSPETALQRIPVPGGAPARVEPTAQPTSAAPQRPAWWGGLLSGGNRLAIIAGLAVAAVAGLVTLIRR